jgi:hypothetical protein
MWIACWVSKAINTPSEYVIRIVFIAKMERRPRLSVMLYVLCLSVINEIHPTALQEPVTGTCPHLENTTPNSRSQHLYGQGKISPFNMPWIKTGDIVVKQLFFFKLGATWGSMGNATLRPPYPQERNRLPTVQEAELFPLPIWTGVEERKFLPPQGFNPLTVEMWCFAIQSKL